MSIAAASDEVGAVDASDVGVSGGGISDRAHEQRVLERGQHVLIDAEHLPGPDPAHRSFETFYDAELAGQVRRAALLLGSPAAANDIVHDAFIAVYRRFDQLDDPGPYLNRCVLNGVRDALRRRDHLAVDPRPVFVADRADEIAVWDALTSLPFRQRAALVLRYWQGLSEAEIAAALGVRPGTVGSLLTRGKRNFERRWER